MPSAGKKSPQRRKKLGVVNPTDLLFNIGAGTIITSSSDASPRRSEHSGATISEVVVFEPTTFTLTESAHISTTSHDGAGRSSGDFTSKPYAGNESAGGSVVASKRNAGGEGASSSGAPPAKRFAVNEGASTSTSTSTSSDESPAKRFAVTADKSASGASPANRQFTPDQSAGCSWKDYESSSSFNERPALNVSRSGTAINPLKASISSTRVIAANLSNLSRKQGSINLLQQQNKTPCSNVSSSPFENSPFAPAPFAPFVPPENAATAPDRNLFNTPRDTGTPTATLPQRNGAVLPQRNGAVLPQRNGAVLPQRNGAVMSSREDTINRLHNLIQSERPTTPTSRPPAVRASRQMNALRILQPAVAAEPFIQNLTPASAPAEWPFNPVVTTIAPVLPNPPTAPSILPAASEPAIQNKRPPLLPTPDVAASSMWNVPTSIQNPFDPSMWLPPPSSSVINPSAPSTSTSMWTASTSTSVWPSTSTWPQTNIATAVEPSVWKHPFTQFAIRAPIDLAATWAASINVPPPPPPFNPAMEEEVEMSPPSAAVPEISITCDHCATPQLVPLINNGLPSNISCVKCLISKFLHDLYLTDN